MWGRASLGRDGATCSRTTVTDLAAGLQERYQRVDLVRLQGGTIAGHVVTAIEDADHHLIAGQEAANVGQAGPASAAMV